MASLSLVGFVSWVIALLLLFGADPSEGQSQQCVTSFTQCVAPLASLGSPTSPGGFKGYCSALTEMMTCINNLDSDCRENDNVQKSVKLLNFVHSLCKAITANGRCNEAIDCFAKWFTGEVKGSCNDVVTMLTCLQTRSRESAQCTIDESKMTFAQVMNLTTDMCSVERDCPQALKCIKMPGMPDLSALQGSSITQETLDKLQPVTFSLTEPGFYCRLLQSAAGCYVTHQSDCGFTDAYVKDMQARHDNLKKTCPPDPNGSSRLVPETVSLVALLILALFRSVF